MEERSTQQQLNDEFAADYKRMNDPEEQEKERIKKRRERFTQDIIEDTGL